jgi:putative membrane protein insertion efficiency factor
VTGGARLLRAVVRGWQLLRAGRPSPCRFTPTCSAYALEAVETHGALRGGALAVRRLAACHPWGRYGFDPVPAAVSHRRTGGAS